MHQMHRVPDLYFHLFLLTLLTVQNKKHIDASVKERPQILIVPSEEIFKRVLCNIHI